MTAEHVDVLVVGAGLSGVGVASQLRRLSPHRSVLVLEARDAIGGTWDLFRYPGVRSDSDMFTLGYSFRPWTGESVIADGSSILRYIEETAQEFGVTERIRCGNRVVGAEFRTTEARWYVEVQRTDGSRYAITAGFLFACTGYYRYDAGYTPRLPGADEFTGTLVHPQHWPQDLDVSGRRVVVIGSGATAVTLVPALARDARHVTMLQRSPTWIVSLPSRDPAALRRPAWWVRARKIALGALGYQVSRRAPRSTRRRLLAAVEGRLPPGSDLTGFTPTYDPWDQRLCVVPDGDLFDAISSGGAEVVTDTIETFTPSGIRLGSGRDLPADVVVTATGLVLSLFDGVTLRVDGRDVDVPGTVVYKGSMLSGVPNFAFAMGYTNASWTLKIDLVSRYVVRLLDHLAATGRTIVTPAEPRDPERSPLIDLTSGYVRRGEHLLPRQGSRAPWRLHQNYLRDLLLFRHRPVVDAGLVLSGSSS